MIKPRGFLYFLLLLLISCGTNQPNIHQQSYLVHSLDSHITPDKEIVALVKPYSTDLNKIMQEVIGTNAHAMTKAKPEGLLGNFVADLSLNWAKQIDSLPEVSICLLNHGGLRTSLPQGEITIGNIYELMPFDNSLVWVKLSSEEMDRLVTYVRATGGQPVSGIQINADNYQLTQTSNQTSYWVLTSDYLADGGDQMDFFLNKERINSGVLLRSIIIEHYRALTKLNRTGETQIDNRINL